MRVRVRVRVRLSYVQCVLGTCAFLRLRWGLVHALRKRAGYVCVRRYLSLRE